MLPKVEKPELNETVPHLLTTTWGERYWAQPQAPTPGQLDTGRRYGRWHSRSGSVRSRTPFWNKVLEALGCQCHQIGKETKGVWVPPSFGTSRS